MAQTALRVITGFLLTLLLTSGARGQTCKLLGGQYGFCQCEMSDGSGIVDLSPYANSNGEPEFAVADLDGYGYNVNLCFPLTKDGTCDKAAGCQSQPGDGSQVSMGRYESAEFVISQDDFYLQFTDGDEERKMKISLVCDQNVPISDREFIFDKEEPRFSYDFILKSQCACPTTSGVCGAHTSDDVSLKESSDPGVVGIVLMCLAFAGLVAYFIVGAVILRVRYQKSGTDLIIHKNFWKDLPFLVKDGVVFTFSPCYNAIRGRSGYSSIGRQ